MGEVSGIAWTDATFNPWWGCTRVSPGCEHCYAETLATVRRKLPVWGVDAERKPMSEAYWREPVKWNKKAAQDGIPRRVFCASMADVFEMPPERNVQARSVQDAARERLWVLIESTPMLDWLLLTKRPENVEQLVPWGGRAPWPRNVWLGVTAEDQKRADERVSLLVQIPARVRFVSHEPALEAVDLSRWLGPDGVHWVITGGESGAKARPYYLNWAADIIEQCRKAGAAPFVKQLGANAWLRGVGLLDDEGDGAVDVVTVKTKDAKGGDVSEWHPQLRVQEFPRPSQATSNAKGEP